MADEPDSADAPPTLPALKIVEPAVNEDDPWHDDVLHRKEIADRLTGIIREQEAPFVISIDGRWGTGKTFLLKRWQQDLENQGWQAIYYNAWEDDFAGDPLLSITGQLSERFKWGAFWAKVRTLGRVVAPLAKAGASTALLATTGIPLPTLSGDSKRAAPDHIADYLAKRAAKDELKKCLADLASEVRRETDQPLVFIIDELDRCRPTYAIELLERVKHIFDVPNIVFVFGINRDELVKSLKSVYGDIDSGTYLRRFFDMEFVLPDADPAQFCQHLVAKFRLADFLTQVDQRRSSPYYVPELSGIAETLPVVFVCLGLSLRDMDYCVRLLALATRDSLLNERLYAGVFMLLAATKVVDPELYQRFVRGDARGADLINNLIGKERAGHPDAMTASNTQRTLNWVEASAYYADDPNRVLRQLRRLEKSEAPDEPEYISSELAALDIQDGRNLQRLRDIIQMMSGGQHFFRGYESARRSLAEKIDLYSDFVRPR